MPGVVAGLGVGHEIVEHDHRPRHAAAPVAQFDLIEAAQLDGASDWTIFRRIVLPLSVPALASLGIFQFLWTWNDLIVALTFGRDTQPITVAIFSQLRQFGSNIEVIAPASFISLAIPLCVFFAFQRYFVQGLLAGSVK